MSGATPTGGRLPILVTNYKDTIEIRKWYLSAHTPMNIGGAAGFRTNALD
jgi:hypothetical protein